MTAPDMIPLPSMPRAIKMVQSELVALGAIYDSKRKFWMIPRANHGAALDLICDADERKPRKLSKREIEFNREEGWTG